MAIIFLFFCVAAIFVVVCIYLFGSDKNNRKDENQNGEDNIFDKFSW